MNFVSDRVWPKGEGKRGRRSSDEQDVQLSLVVFCYREELNRIIKNNNNNKETKQFLKSEVLILVPSI